MPIFPAGTTKITPELAFEKRDGKVVYFNGHLPVFTHAAEDLGAFRLYSSQLIVNGTASQRQMVEAFGVPRVTVKRCVKRLGEQGAGVFFKAAERQGGSKLTRLCGLEGVTLRNPLEINAATSKVGTTNSLAGVHDLERKSWVVVAPATPV